MKNNSLYSQPDNLNYQFQLINEKDTAIPNQNNINIELSILKNSVNGTEIYKETFITSSDSFGIVNIKIGKGNAIFGNFKNLNFLDTTYFIKMKLEFSSKIIEVAPFEITSTSPYSYYSNVSKKIVSPYLKKLTNVEISNITDKDSLKFLEWSGTKWVVSKNKSSDFVELNNSNKINDAFIPDVIKTNLKYLGTWDAFSNKPIIGSGGLLEGQPNNKAKIGEFLIIKSNGLTLVDGISLWNIEDIILFDGTKWQKIPKGVLVIKSATIDEKKLADQSITEEKLEDNSITTEKILFQTISSEDLGINSINNQNFVQNTILDEDFASNALFDDNFIPGSIKSSQIENNAVTSLIIKDGSITTKHFNNDITGDKLQDNSITEAKILDNSLENILFIDNAFSNNTLANDLVTENKIKDNIIQTNSIADNSIENIDIKSEQIVSSHIQNGTIINEDIANDAVDNVNIKSLSLISSNFADGSVNENSLDTNSIKTNHILNGIIETSHIKNSEFTNDYISPNTINNNHFVNYSITTDKIVKKSIPGSKLADNSIGTPELSNIIFKISNAELFAQSSIISSKLTKIGNNAFLNCQTGISGINYYNFPFSIALKSIGKDDIKDKSLSSGSIANNAFTISEVNRLIKKKSLSRVKFASKFQIDKFGVGSVSPSINNTSTNLLISSTSTNVIPLKIFSSKSSNSNLILFKIDLNEIGGIYKNGSDVSYTGFTGGHIGMTNKPINSNTLVSLKYTKFKEKNKTGEAIYMFTPSKKVNDEKIIGVVNNVDKTKKNQDIIAVGNGNMPIIYNGSDIEIGDYLISSNEEGYAMKDNGDFEVAHIIAKVVEPINWENINTFLPNGKKYTNVSVFFTNFERFHHKVLEEKIEELNKLIEELKLKKISKNTSYNGNRIK